MNRSTFNSVLWEFCTTILQEQLESSNIRPRVPNDDPPDRFRRSHQERNRHMVNQFQGQAFLSALIRGPHEQLSKSMEEEFPESESADEVSPGMETFI
jgi:hypothetical protein